MSGNVQYANWWSKVLFQKSYENQFVIPLPPPKVWKAFMEFLERRVFTPDLQAIQIDRPVFIVGLPRSGTSMLYNLMSAHEKSAFVTTTMNSFPTAICSIEWLRKTLRLNIRGERFLQDSIDGDFGTPSEPAMFWGKWTDRDTESLYWEERRLKDFTPEKLQEIQNDIKRVIHCHGGQGQRFVTKYPVFQTELRMIQDWFPDAHFIHIIRDGRMVANSLVKLHKLVNDQIEKIQHPDLKYLVPYPRVKNLKKYIDEYGADNIRCTAHIWQDSIDTVNAVRGDLKNFMEVRYESILEDPHGEMKKVFDFAGFSWPEETNENFKKEFEAIGKIKHTNRYGQFEVVEQIADRTLKAYGYH